MLPQEQKRLPTERIAPEKSSPAAFVMRDEVRTTPTRERSKHEHKQKKAEAADLVFTHHALVPGVPRTTVVTPIARHDDDSQAFRKLGTSARRVSMNICLVTDRRARPPRHFLQRDADFPQPVTRRESHGLLRDELV